MAHSDMRKQFPLMLSAALLLAGCAGVDSPVLHTLTVGLEGVSEARVVVWDITTDKALFDDLIQKNKVFSGLPARTQVRIKASNIAGFETPPVREVILNSDTTVGLTYKKQAVQVFQLRVTLEGTTSAPVTVRNKATGGVLYEGMVTGELLLEGLALGTVVLVEPKHVDFLATPELSTTTMDRSQSIVIAYVSDPRLSETLSLSGKAEISGTTPREEMALRVSTTSSPQTVGILQKDFTFSAQFSPALHDFATDYFGNEKQGLRAMGCDVSAYEISREAKAYAFGNISTSTFFDAAQFFRYFVNIAFISPETRVDALTTFVDVNTFIFTRVPVSVKGFYKCGSKQTNLNVVLVPGWNILTKKTTFTYDGGRLATTKEDISSGSVNNYSGPYKSLVLSAN